ncbi:MAG: S26 family signal peptidase [Gemmataceae bacterium]
MATSDNPSSPSPRKNPVIGVSTSSSPAKAANAANKPAKPQPKNNFRETVETVVFVVVMVLLLKMFVVEAFVIPTGSMAETLLGYHKIFTCPECGHTFPINCSDEVDPQDGNPYPVKDCRCPNCLYEQTFSASRPSPAYSSGDRVLVHKAMYHVNSPKRWEIVVFKFPAEPQKKQVPMNYIKRLWGFGGESHAIHRGEVLMTKALTYPGEPEPDRPEDLWQPNYYRHNAEEARHLFEKGRISGFPEGENGFELLRKPDDIMMAERRLVYDNDHQSEMLISKGAPPRWSTDPKRDGGGTFAADNTQKPKVFTQSGNKAWIRYQHLTENLWANPPNAMPAPIRNMMGYNTPHLPPMKKQDLFDYWCGDLMLECQAKLTSADSKITLELSKGEARYQARIANGTVTLLRTGDGTEKIIAERPCPVKAAGTYDLRFSNIDCRLRVHVNGKAVEFGKDADYPLMPVKEYDPLDTGREGWTLRNDLEAPASIGAEGGVEVSHLKIWRDTVYTAQGLMNRPDHYAEYVDTFYVQPGHYLCLGDNSAQSSDSRDWGTVPERLMLGRAVFIFWPFTRIGFIK